MSSGTGAFDEVNEYNGPRGDDSNVPSPDDATTSGAAGHELDVRRGRGSSSAMTPLVQETPLDSPSADRPLSGASVEAAETAAMDDDDSPICQRLSVDNAEDPNDAVIFEGDLTQLQLQAYRGWRDCTLSFDKAANVMDDESWEYMNELSGDVVRALLHHMRPIERRRRVNLYVLRLGVGLVMAARRAKHRANAPGGAAQRATALHFEAMCAKVKENAPSAVLGKRIREEDQ